MPMTTIISFTCKFENVFFCEQLTNVKFVCFYLIPLLPRLKTGYLERGHESRLVINNVTYDYQGEYECRATNQINGQERTVASEPVSLQVVGECTFECSMLVKLWFSAFVTLSPNENQNTKSECTEMQF